MTSPRPELPDDIKACHALLEQLRAELDAARDQVAKLQSAVEAHDAKAHDAKAQDAAAQDARAQIAQLEELLARQQETIREQEQTIENLAADNALLKRALFGSRRERFTDDPAQTLLSMARQRHVGKSAAGFHRHSRALATPHENGCNPLPLGV